MYLDYLKFLSALIKQSKPNNSNYTTTTNKSKGYTIIPYVQGLCKSITNIFGKYGIQTYFMGNRAIKNILVSSKDKYPKQ